MYINHIGSNWDRTHHEKKNGVWYDTSYLKYFHYRTSILITILFNNFNNLTSFHPVSSGDDILKSHVVYIVGRSYVTFEYKRGLQHSAPRLFQSNQTSDADASLSHSTNMKYHKSTTIPYYNSHMFSSGVVLGTTSQHWVPHVANVSTNFLSTQISNIIL